jgi:hypothetical protein
VAGVGAAATAEDADLRKLPVQSGVAGTEVLDVADVQGLVDRADRVVPGSGRLERSRP